MAGPGARLTSSVRPCLAWQYRPTRMVTFFIANSTCRPTELESQTKSLGWHMVWNVCSDFKHKYQLLLPLGHDLVLLNRTRHLYNRFEKFHCKLILSSSSARSFTTASMAATTNFIPLSPSLGVAEAKPLGSIAMQIEETSISPTSVPSSSPVSEDGKAATGVADKPAPVMASTRLQKLLSGTLRYRDLS